MRALRRGDGNVWLLPPPGAAERGAVLGGWQGEAAPKEAPVLMEWTGMGAGLRPSVEAAADKRRPAEPAVVAAPMAPAAPPTPRPPRSPSRIGDAAGPAPGPGPGRCDGAASEARRPPRALPPVAAAKVPASEAGEWVWTTVAAPPEPNSLRAPPRPPPEPAHGGAAQWSWATVHDSGNAKRGPGPRGSAEPAPSGAGAGACAASAPDLRSLVLDDDGAGPAAGAASALDLRSMATAEGILDLSKCWGAPATAAGPEGGPLSLREGLPLALSPGEGLLPQWGSVAPHPLCPSFQASLDTAKASEPVAVTSTLLKELLVTDYGSDPDPATRLGACGGCIWQRGLRALAAADVAGAGACFATGQAPVPPRLVQGLDPHSAPWAQFWCVYYAWAMGYGAALPPLRAGVRAKRREVARRLAGSVRLLPLPGGAATAATINGLIPESTVRNPLSVLLKAVYIRLRGAASHTDAALLELVGPNCAAHVTPLDLPDVAEAGPGPVAKPPKRPSPASPLAPLVNGMLGFPDALFVGPTGDAAQRKTGSVFRPFHSVEEALRHVRCGQTVVLLPGVYSPMRVCDIHADAQGSVRIQGIGRVVVTTPQKLPWSSKAALIKVRNCNNVVLAGMVLRTCGLGIDLGDDCYNVSLQGIVMEDVYKACKHPLAGYHNIKFMHCILNERKHTGLAAFVQRLAHLQLRHRLVYVGMVAHLLTLQAFRHPIYMLHAFQVPLLMLQTF